MTEQVATEPQNIRVTHHAYNDFRPVSQQVRSELVWCSPAMARELRDSCHFERQRSIDPRNVERLGIEMARGRFIEGTQIYFCVLPDGTMVIVNGNHTLEAVAGGTRQVLLSFCYRPIRNLDEAGAIYARFDIQKVRDWRAALRAHGLESVLSSPQWTNPVGAALLHMLQGFNAVSQNVGDIELKTSRDIRAKLFKENAEFAEIVIAAVLSASNAEAAKFFRRSGVLAVGMELVRYQPSAALDFISSVARDDGLKLGDPQRALLKFLREHPTSSKTERAEQSRATAACWNAYFDGRSQQYVKPNTMGEMRLAGTPWNGKFDPVQAYVPELAKQAPASLLRKPGKA